MEREPYCENRITKTEEFLCLRALFYKFYVSINYLHLLYKFSTLTIFLLNSLLCS